MDEPFWNESRIARLKDLRRNTTMSFEEISRLPEFGEATRDAIAGKCFRMGLCKPDPGRHRARRRA